MIQYGYGPRGYFPRSDQRGHIDCSYRGCGIQLSATKQSVRPSDVVDSQTVDTFPRRLKHFIFNVSFS